MSLRAKPGSSILSGNAGISAELKAQGYTVTLCFSVEPNASEEAVTTIREGFCDIHVTEEQYAELQGAEVESLRQEAARWRWVKAKMPTFFENLQARKGGYDNAGNLRITAEEAVDLAIRESESE